MAVTRPSLEESLNSRAVRGTAAVFVSQAAKFALHFTLAIVMARLVSPEDFGLFGIAFAVTGFLEFAKTGGIVVPVVQSETLTPEQLNTLFWFNAGLGLLITLVGFTAAPFVGYFFSDARLVPITCVLALVFLSGGLSTQHYALLRREMRFTALACCEVTAFGVAACVAIVAALYGAKYWALVYFHLAREVIQSALVIATTRWIPVWPSRWAAVGPLVRFGGLMMAFDLIGYLNFKLDNLIVGYFLGPAALGFYDRAYQFLLLPVSQINQPLSTVVQSTLSRLQRDTTRYRSHLTRALLLTTALGMPLIAFLYANADVVIAQLLGAQWLPSAPIFRALAPAAFVMSITASIGWIFLPLGRARRQLPWSIFTTAITIAAFLVGVRWGVVGVALAFSMSRVALLIPTLQYTCADTGLEWTDILRTAARPAAASVVAVAFSASMSALFPMTTWTLPRNAAIFAVAYLVCWIVVPGGRAVVRDNLRLTMTHSRG
jgi:O-antigen/teichoic acid export membrane protein